jgi:putative sterol carrier protein
MQMGYFKDADEVYEYIGGVFRKAGEDPEVGPKLRAANVTMQLTYSDPDAKLTVRFREPYEVIDGGDDQTADVKMSMPADIAHKYWRGEYNFAVGLAKGQVKAKGPISKILKLVPVTKPLFPIYKQMTDAKDSAGSSV